MPVSPAGRCPFGSTPNGFLHFTSTDIDGYQAVVNTPDQSIEAGKWYHFAGVIDRATGRMEAYLDGQLVGVSTEVPDVDPFASTAPLLVGQTAETSASYASFRGVVDEVRLWNVARTQSQIRTDMSVNVAPDAPGLVGDWRFGELPVNAGLVRDSSVNGNDGTILGTPVRLVPPVHTTALDSPADELWLEARSDEPNVLVSVQGAQIAFTTLKNFAGTARITVIAHDGSGLAGTSNGRTAEYSFDVTFRDNAIYGVKFNDLNHDGVRQAGEPGLDGIKLFLDANGDNVLDPGEQFTFTDANGEYALRDLDPEPAVPAVVTAASALATLDLADGGTFEQYNGSSFSNFKSSLVIFNVALTRTDSYAIRDVHVAFTLNGADLGEIVITPALVATNTTLSNLVADINGLLTSRGLGELIVAGSNGTQIEFRTLAAGNNQVLKVTTSTQTRFEDRVFTRQFTGLFGTGLTDFQLGSRRTTSVTNTAGGLGFATPNQTGQGGDAAPRIVEIPAAGWAPTTGAASDGSGPVGVRTVTFSTPGEISIGNDFGNEQLATLEVISPPVEALVEGALLSFSGSVITSDPGDPPPDSALAPAATLAPTYALSWRLLDTVGHEIKTGTGDTFEFVAPDQGNYTLYFSAFDETTQRSLYPLAVPFTVRNVAPTFDLGADTGVDEGGALRLPGATLTDPGVNDVLTLTLDWGDAITATRVFDPQAGQTLADFLADIGHVYQDDGIYTVKVTADDGDGGITIDSLVCTVSNVAPSVFAGPDQTAAAGDEVSTLPSELPVPAILVSAQVGDSVTIGDGVADGPVGAYFTDPGALDTFEATIDWGDGSATELLAIQPAQDNNGEIIHGLLGSHVFLQQGEFNVVVTVTDDDGGVGTDAFVVVVGNPAPEWVLDVGEIVRDEGTNVELLGSGVYVAFTDAGVLDSFEATIDWGDGTGVQPASFTLDSQPDENGHQQQIGRLRDSHVYADNGTYTVSLSVNDGDNTSDTSFVLSVTNAAPALADLDAASIDEGSEFTVRLEFSDPGTRDSHVASIAWSDAASTGGSEAGAPVFVVDESVGATPASQAMDVAETPFGPPGSVDGMTGTLTATRSFAQDGDYVATVTLTDDDGGTTVREYSVHVNNVAPTVTAVNELPEVDEGQDFEFKLAEFVDPGRLDQFTASIDWGDGNTTVLESLNAVDGAGDVIAGHRYVDDGRYGVIVTVFDDALAAGSDTIDIVVAMAAPVVTISGAATAAEETPYLLDLAVDAPGAAAIQGWEVDWGDGTVSAYEPAATQVSHTYAPGPGNVIREIVARATDAEGVWTSNTLSVAVSANLLRVESVTPSESSFHVRFNRAFDPGLINLYEGLDSDPARTGATDLRVVVGNSTVALRGSLLMDADKQGFTFVRTGAPLLPGGYTVTLASRANGWVDLLGRPLDGDGDGNAGGDAVLHFDGPAAGPVLSLPDFIRGPGQDVVLPNNNASGINLPMSVSGAAGLRSLVVRIDYDTALLDIASVELARGLAGSVRTSGDAGSLVVEVTLDAALPATPGSMVLLDLVASVPATASYGQAQRIDLTVLESNVELVADDALQIAAYLADTTGNAAYTTDDAATLQRVTTGIATGFGAYPVFDPLIIGDIAGPGLNLFDVIRLNALVNGGAGIAEIPAIPDDIGPLTFAGPDPLVSITANPRGRPGSTVTVPVSLDTAEGLDSVLLKVAYDASALEVAEVRRGSLSGDFQWFVRKDEPGLLSIDMARLEPLAGGSGTLLEIDFRIRDSAPAGQTAVDLQFVSLNDTRLTLNPAPTPGLDPTDGTITVVRPAAAARVDWSGWFADSKPLTGVRSVDSKDDDWMSSPWARDLTDRLAPAASGSSAETPRSRTASPGRELLRAISRVFSR